MITPLAIKLLLAHLIGDFLFQPKHWVNDKFEKKHKSRFLYFHVVVHAASLLVLLQGKYLWSILIILVTHLIIDAVKLYFTTAKNAKILFVIDQLAHVAVLIAVSYFIEPFNFNFAAILNPQFLLLCSGVILVTRFSAIIMGYIMGRWNRELNAEGESLKGAGEYIGILERLFVFTFILLNAWWAIGLLITAKSVFRFGDLTNAKDRKLTEYVLIGTLLSFGLAMIFGLGYKALVKFL